MERKTPVSFSAVYSEIVGRVAQGRYRAARRIEIATLAQSLGVSTTPVREALRQLAGRDVVVDRHREGFYLAPLNRKAIASLYGAHEHWMERILAHSTWAGSGGSRPVNIWRLFELCAVGTGDVAMVAVRRYLDNRLMVLRRFENAIVGNANARALAFARAITARDEAGALEVSHGFHQCCVAQAEQLAAALDLQA